MEIAFNKIIGIVLLVVAVVIVILAFSPGLIENSKAVISLCNFAPVICPTNVYSKEGIFIKHFEIEPYLGKQIRIEWLLVKPNEDDPNEELKRTITFNGSGVDPPQNVVFKTRPKNVNDIYSAIVELPDYEPYTFRITAKDDNDEELETREKLYEPLAGFDRPSVEDFISLNEILIPALQAQSKTYSVGSPRTKPDYRLSKELRIVGFNNGVAKTTCGSKDAIIPPAECTGQTCLCLCERPKNGGKDCSTVDRLCFAYTDVDYFIGGDESGVERGDNIFYPGIGSTNYLVIEGRCNSNYWNGLNGWKERMIKIELITKEDKTFIRIAEV